MDLAKLFRPNPFAGDDGSMPPEIAAALAEQDSGLRLEKLVDALARGRVLIGAGAHEHPGRTADGGVAEHTEVQDPEGEAIKEAASRGILGPGMRVMMPIFTHIDALRAFDSTLRPIPVLARNACAQALMHGGMVVCDPLCNKPENPGGIYLGRSAVLAIASAGSWLAPWKDPRIIEILNEAIAHSAVEAIKLEALPNGVTRILCVLSQANTQAVKDLRKVISFIGSDPYLKARLDLVELAPQKK